MQKIKILFHHSKHNNDPRVFKNTIPRRRMCVPPEVRAVRKDCDFIESDSSSSGKKSKKRKKPKKKRHTSEESCSEEEEKPKKKRKSRKKRRNDDDSCSSDDEKPRKKRRKSKKKRRKSSSSSSSVKSKKRKKKRKRKKSRKKGKKKRGLGKSGDPWSDESCSDGKRKKEKHFDECPMVPCDTLEPQPQYYPCPEDLYEEIAPQTPPQQVAKQIQTPKPQKSPGTKFSTKISFRDPVTMMETVVIISDKDEFSGRSPMDMSQTLNNDMFSNKGLGGRTTFFKECEIEEAQNVFTFRLPNDKNSITNKFDENYVSLSNKSDEVSKMIINKNKFCQIHEVIGNHKKDHNFQLSPQIDDLNKISRKQIPNTVFLNKKRLTEINNFSVEPNVNKFKYTLNTNATFNQRSEVMNPRSKRYNEEKPTIHEQENISRQVQLGSLRETKNVYLEDLLISKISRNDTIISTSGSERKSYIHDGKEKPNMNKSFIPFKLKHAWSKGTKNKNYQTKEPSELYRSSKITEENPKDIIRPQISEQLEKSSIKNKVIGKSRCISEETEVSDSETDRKTLPSGMLYYYSDESWPSNSEKNTRKKSNSKSFWKRLVYTLTNNKNLNS